MKYYVTIVLVIVFGKISAQKTETVSRVIYNFSHVIDSSKPKQPYKEMFSLLFSNTKSYYLSRAREIDDSANQAAMAAMEAGLSKELVIQSNGGTKDKLFINLSKQQLHKLTLANNQQYAVLYSYPKIDWKLQPGDKKQILGYTCSKASGVFAGRRYTVWYAPAITTSTGPWKLLGLPGLILQAADDKNQVQFQASSIEILKVQANMELPKKTIFANATDFDRMLSAGTFGRPGISSSDVVISGVKIEGGGKSATPNKMFINNPLELKP